MDSMSSILITGLPRSGTTWVGEVLSAAPNTRYLFEPDNEKISPVAWLCKNSFHRFPYLVPGEDGGSYERLWRAILSDGMDRFHVNRLLKLFLNRKISSVERHIGEKCAHVQTDMRLNDVVPIAPAFGPDGNLLFSLAARAGMGKGSIIPGSRLIVKSVHTPLCLEWLTRKFNLKVLIVLRNPYSLYASYLRMNMPDGFRNPLSQERLLNDFKDSLPERAFKLNGPADAVAFQIAFMYRVIDEQISRNGNWVLTSHDRICSDPVSWFMEIYKQLGIDWPKNALAKLTKLNGEGNGYTPTRIASQQPTKWKKELDKADIEAIEYWVNEFQLEDFFERHVAIR